MLGPAEAFYTKAEPPYAACHNANMHIREIATLGPVIAAIPALEPAQAVSVARALKSGGLHVLELNLHGTGAIASIDAIRKALPEVIIGVTALTKAADFAAAGRLGAHFGVTSGLTSELAAATRGARFPVRPGVMTPSDVVAAQHAGFKVMALFPAELAGGVRMLNVLDGDFPDLEFYAAGGISRETAPQYLALPKVLCVRGAWVAPQSLIDAADWSGIEALAREAASLATSQRRGG
jgi:2-dehydro-3-deoxyphosphogluconate aldolase / (4S)-4-hydroxy-2-oxoglutarate aldolase